MNINEKIDNYLNESIRKITKSAFKKIYKELGLVSGGVKGDVNYISKTLNNIDVSKIKPLKVSQIDVGSQGSSGTTTTVYELHIKDETFYVVESKYDNSKNNNVSWNTIDYYSTVYILKK